MTRETKKSFERIRAVHTNEFAQDLATYQQALQSWHPPENKVQFFGCGDGEFTSRFAT
ncbi:MAG: hypothetical protein RMI89_12315 [Gloeomargarita sp. SKYBB_i_bin120]|nr:hypothetical protein [Gloeomargarita sp. SKYB120]MDW8179296.1 hypothetical protein [Gloeomargarita sp. SKYBB_i_bin120]